MARKKNMSYEKYLDKYQQRDQEPKKYYTYMDKFNPHNSKKGNGMAYNKKKKNNKKKNGSGPMIMKDHNAPANLPQQEKHVMYSKPFYTNGDMYNVKDSIQAQDYQVETDVRQLYKDKNGKYPEKY